MVVSKRSLALVDCSHVRAFSIFEMIKALQVCINRFDDETKQDLELYDKVDGLSCQKGRFIRDYE